MTSPGVIEGQFCHYCDMTASQDLVEFAKAFDSKWEEKGHPRVDRKTCPMCGVTRCWWWFMRWVQNMN